MVTARIMGEHQIRPYLDIDLFSALLKPRFMGAKTCTDLCSFNMRLNMEENE